MTLDSRSTAFAHRRRRFLIVMLVALILISAVGTAALPRTATAGSLQDNSSKPMNILLLGSDARPGEQIDKGVRSDIIAVLHLDPSTGICRLLSIPRDSRVDVPGYGLTKINHAMMEGGVPLERQTIENFLGIKIDNYALIDFVGAADLIDALGGVTLTNPQAFDWANRTYEAGTLTLNGADAVFYARYRGGPDGDFGRIQRQHDVLQAVLKQVSTVDVAKVAPELWIALRGHTKTDLKLKELIGIAQEYRGSCTADSIEMSHLEGTTATFADPIFGVDLSYVVIDPQEVQQKVAALTATG